MENEDELALALIKSSQKSTFLPFWKSIFENKKEINNNFNGKNRSKEGDGANALLPLPIPHLSPLAHSVIHRCSRILQISSGDLQQRFDQDLPDKVRQPEKYARNFLEYCSFQTIHHTSLRPDYLSDKDFRRLMYDMMLAWESSGVENGLLVNFQRRVSNSKVEGVDEDESSIFYSTSTKMAVQVDDKKTVGPEAFARIAPACSIVADIITVHNLFDILTSSSDHRLHFLIFNKYLQSLQKVVKAVNNGLGIQYGPNLSLAEEESILDVDGTVPTQPVLQHIGISAWPGRLTLTNHALYFESGIGIYDEAVRYDLATDLKQSIKPELTGPLGARLFDKAVMYKSMTMEDPVYFEFPEFKGSSRRDYWLDICLEILRAHRFIRKYKLKENQQQEALARAMLGILRYRAIREGFCLFSSNYKTLLCFNLAESLPGGDVILETLSSQLTARRNSGSPNVKKLKTPPISLWTLHRLGIISCKDATMNTEVSFGVGGVHAGEINPLHTAVRQSIQDSGRAEAAQASVDQVKVEGVDTNLAVMKELLGPLINSFDKLQLLISWDEPWKSVLFLLLISYAIVRGWIKYVFALIFLLLASNMLWHKYTRSEKPLEAFKIKAPPTKNPLEQLLALQEAIAQVESSIQCVNIVLLKVRALMFAVIPEATDKVSLLLVFVALAITLLPLKYMILLVFLESFTRNMPLRRASTYKWMRRMKEWWIRIPAAPVWLIKSDLKKRK